jgi:hypothetical protein
VAYTHNHPAYRIEETVEKMRVVRGQCPEHGLGLRQVAVEGRREQLACPDKFCGHSVTRDR